MRKNSRIGLTPGTLICRNCKEELPESSFNKDKHQACGRNRNCKKCDNEKQRARYKANLLESREKCRIYSIGIRTKVLNHYGHKCACCGESRYEFLALDHVNNDGAAHRKEFHGGQGRGNTRSMMIWLIKSGYPPGFQVLCHNCNMAKGLYGSCPHQSL